MKKYLPYIAIILSVLLVVVSFLYFLEKSRKQIDVVSPSDIKLEIRPEVYEQEFGEYVLFGFLMENKIREEGYIVLRIDMSRYFINPPAITKDVRIIIPEHIPIVLWDFAIDKKTFATVNDLKRLDQINVSVNLPISVILEEPEFIAHPQVTKVFQSYGLSESEPTVSE